MEEKLGPRRIGAGAFLLSWDHAPFYRNADGEMSGLDWLLWDIMILEHSDTRGCSVFLQDSDIREKQFTGIMVSMTQLSLKHSCGPLPLPT